MSRQVQIAPNVVDIVLPDNRRYQGGATAVLTDDQFAQISAGALVSLVIDQGSINATSPDLPRIATRTGYTVPNQSGWVDTPGTVLTIPAGVGFCLKMTYEIAINQGTVAAGVTINPQIRVVDFATGAVVYLFDDPVDQFASASGGLKVLSRYKERDFLPLTVATPVKMQTNLLLANLGSVTLFDGFGLTPIVVKCEAL